MFVRSGSEVGSKKETRKSIFHAETSQRKQVIYLHCSQVVFVLSALHEMYMYAIVFVVVVLEQRK